MFLPSGAGAAGGSAGPIGMPPSGVGAPGAIGAGMIGAGMMPSPGVGGVGGVGGGFGGPPDPNSAGYRLRTDPELHRLYLADFEYERQCQSLAARIREAPEDERAPLMQELTELVQRHFDVRQQRRRWLLQLLEEELARTREAIEARQAARDALIQRRIQELTGTQPVLDF